MFAANFHAFGAVACIEGNCANFSYQAASFGRLARGEFGLLVDANGHLAVVAGQASAAHWLNIAAGELLVLAW